MCSTAPTRPARHHRARRRAAHLAAGAALVLAATTGTAIPAHAAFGHDASTTSRTGALAWGPPALSDPTTITVPEDGQVTGLDKARDYRLVCSGTVHGTLHIDGGHDVVLIGCTVDAGTGRDAYFQDTTGTLHVQGIDFASVQASEGIDLAEPKGSVVQLEDLWMGQVNGSRSTNHADVIQTWAGPSVLRVDRLVGWTTYQGFFLLPGQHTSDTGPWSVNLRHVALVGVGEHSAYQLWTPTLDANFHLSLDDVVSVRTGDKAVQDQTTWSGGKGGIDGMDIVPTASNPLAAVPGADYHSPGYSS